MATYVLIHGFMHGGWCWDKVVPGLEAAGHTVHAPDLPGQGSDTTPIAEVTLDAWVERVGAILTAQPEPSILVGHSLGGLPITQAGEDFADHVATLVYLTAYLPANGQMSADLRDPDSMVVANMVLSDDGLTAGIKDEAIKPGFYTNCSDEDVAWAKPLLKPMPVAPVSVPVRTTAANWGRIPRVYIECLRDRAMPPAAQKRMYTDIPCERVITMDSDHSPMMSQPEQLVEHLLSI